MSTFQRVLSAFAAIGTAFFVIIAFATDHAKATGLAAVTGLTFLSWEFWLLAAFCFFLFLTASRIGNNILRGLLFWVPVTAMSVLGLSVIALLTYLLVSMHLRNG
jgi:hypothetical protein